jgi:hypothetical protein
MSVPPGAGTSIFCEQCGRSLAADATVCPRCGYEVADEEAAFAALQDWAAASPPPAAPDPQPAIQSSSSGRPQISGTPITLGDGEKVWREYAVTTLPSVRLLGIPLGRATGNGTLYVTDSRVMFFATFQKRGGKRSVLLQETQLEHVTGISAYVARSFSLVAIAVVAVLALAGLAQLANGPVGNGLLLLILAAVGAMFLAQGLGQRGSVGVRIHSGATQASPLGFGEIGEGKGLLSRARGGATDLLMGLPGPQAEQVVNELGALIADLRSKGTLAGTHWGVG